MQSIRGRTSAVQQPPRASDSSIGKSATLAPSPKGTVVGRLQATAGSLANTEQLGCTATPPIRLLGGQRAHGDQKIMQCRLQLLLLAPVCDYRGSLWARKPQIMSHLPADHCCSLGCTTEQLGVAAEGLTAQIEPHCARQ